MLASFRRSPVIKQTTASGALSPTSALAPTHQNAITPNKPGDFKAYRWMEPIAKSKPLTTTEVIQLEAIAVKAEAMAIEAEKGYKSAEKISNAQSRLHKAYNGYRQVEAKNEFGIQESNAKVASLLESLRPGYQQLAQGIQAVHMAADMQIDNSIALFG